MLLIWLFSTGSEPCSGTATQGLLSRHLEFHFWDPIQRLWLAPKTMKATAQDGCEALEMALSVRAIAEQHMDRFSCVARAW